MKGKDGCAVGAGIPGTAMIAASVFFWCFSCSFLDICSKMYAYIYIYRNEYCRCCPFAHLDANKNCTCNMVVTCTDSELTATAAKPWHGWCLHFLDANLRTSQHYLRNPHLHGFKTQMDCFTKIWMNFANPTRWLLFFDFRFRVEPRDEFSWRSCVKVIHVGGFHVPWLDKIKSFTSLDGWNRVISGTQTYILYTYIIYWYYIL